jgi:acetyl-CoA acetyltransferase
VKLEDVAVLGVGMTRFGIYPDRSSLDLAREAGLAALDDAGISFAEVDEAFVGYIFDPAMTGIRAMKEFGLTGLPVTHVENASATGLVAFRDAAHAVASGRADVAMALGFDKMSDAARRSGRERGQGRDSIDNVILPAAYFSLWAMRRMHERGTRPERRSPP